MMPSWIWLPNFAVVAAMTMSAPHRTSHRRRAENPAPPRSRFSLSHRLPVRLISPFVYSSTKPYGPSLDVGRRPRTARLCRDDDAAVRLGVECKQRRASSSISRR